MKKLQKKIMDSLFCPSCGLRLEGSGLERKGTC